MIGCVILVQLERKQQDTHEGFESSEPALVSRQVVLIMLKHKHTHTVTYNNTMKPKKEH